MYWLTILALKSILSSVIGSTFYVWFQDTKIGIWFQKKVDQFMEHFAEKYDIEVAKKDSKFRSLYPLQADRLDKVEKLAHPKCGLESFDGYDELIKRIDKLEKKIK